jgi:Uma2 family endonuclease
MATTPNLHPVLENGDRLTRDEFNQRYQLRPDIRKAELVLGVVHVASPTRLGAHADPHSLVALWLRAYEATTPGVRVGIEGTVYLDDDGEVQPDGFMFWFPPHASRARQTADDYVEGAPDLVVEIAASSASYDLHDKKDAYRRAGVSEYMPWRVLDGAIDWFRLQDGEYLRVEPDTDGMIESAVFPGLRLDVATMLAGDTTGVLAALGFRRDAEQR